MELIPEATDARLPGLVLDARAQRGPHVGRVVDAWRDLAQDAAGAQLVDDRGRDAETGGDPLHAGRSGARRAQALEELADALVHLRVESRLRVRESNAPPGASEAAVGHQVVDHASQVGFVQRQRLRTAVPRRRPAIGGRPNARHQRVHAQIGRQRLFLVEPSQGRQDQALRHPALLGIDSPDAHPGRVPSVAIRMASDSSSERWCGEPPLATGLAKTRVFERP
jgi:hypothetical protein